MPELGHQFDKNALCHEDAATPFQSGDQLDFHASTLDSLGHQSARAEEPEVDIPTSLEVSYQLHEVVGAYAVHLVRIRRQHLGIGAVDEQRI